MKRPLRWHALVKGVLASLAVAVAVFFLIHRIRVTFPPPPNAAHTVQPRPIRRPPEGPPMRIDPDELARAGRERNDNGLEMKLCWCPPGSFHMGRSNRYKNPGVGVTLRHGFWMGKFEVTQAQWKRIMGVTLREQRTKDLTQPRPVGDGSMRDHVGEGPNHPIYYTSHADSEEFCRKLTTAEREAGRLEPEWKYRVPTEAEWEFACRSGTTTDTAFGDQLSSTQANFDGTMPLNGAPVGPYLHETTSAGSYPPNAWGLHDMHGNVLEWCLFGDERESLELTDSIQKPAASTRWAMRGGCWHDPGAQCVSTSGGEVKFDARGSGLGFRVVLAPSKS